MGTLVSPETGKHTAQFFHEVLPLQDV
uniref:Uncharacterized protein MANES_03G033900 n=1 Tax=Rhizophora mucronata TaxID=61149 RepID=A0A2P2KLH3_RHIMU